jgi:hypothetical protein
MAGGLRSTDFAAAVIPKIELGCDARFPEPRLIGVSSCSISPGAVRILRNKRLFKRNMYEHRRQPLLSRAKFTKRVIRHFILALLVLAAGLGIGVLGYHCLGELNWIDSLLNASMILGGMGPVEPLHSSAAKIFASCYALFSGLAFIGIASVIIAPFAHRILHRFNLDKE